MLVAVAACEFGRGATMTDSVAVATLYDGSVVRGRLTTDHAASSYGQPVFVGNDGQAIDWIAIREVKVQPGQIKVTQ